VQDATQQTVFLTEDCPTNLILGEVSYDNENDGCDLNDVRVENLKMEVSQGASVFTAYTAGDGTFVFPVQAGNYTVSVVPEHQSYFNITPQDINVNFPFNDNSEIIQDFCVTSNGNFNDLEIILVSITEARPGFESIYEVLIKNNGTTSLSGDVKLFFNDDVMDFVSSSQAPFQQNQGELLWSFTDLEPFEVDGIEVVMDLNTPTDPTFPLVGGEILEFTGIITSIQTDETPEDNEILLSQTVVNSFDPNDITCIQGGSIAVEEVGEYVHYLIRFENVGTANAVNIKVSNQIDIHKFDISTMIPINSSHNMVTRIVNTDEIEFIFDDINLPFNDLNNDGYIMYKIKSLPNLMVGDILENQAKIFFDFNPPIITNTATTEIIENPLAINDLTTTFETTIYPNPTDKILYFKTNHALDLVKIYDLSGNTLLTLSQQHLSDQEIDLSFLAAGFYLVEIHQQDKKTIEKLLIN
ncbi:MAG: T9SS type A sorting domain-containing protein, partial [Marinirhabdus sp.]|nr:T9SS type A sorting domain-containing protein [Marinirhabdus sp.]